MSSRSHQTLQPSRGLTRAADSRGWGRLQLYRDTQTFFRDRPFASCRNRTFLILRSCEGQKGAHMSHLLHPFAADGNVVVMTARRSRKLLMMVILLEFTNDIWMLPAPKSVSMDSVNMRHVLRWMQPKVECNTTIHYTVQYQGEFELLIKNGSWIDAPECQEIPLPHCDLTFDLGSDSDYSLRVRARCGSKLSAWTKSSFNRNNITPPVPEIKVTTEGDVLLVSVRKFPLTAVTRVMMWREDEEQQVKVHLIPADQKVLQVAALQEGAVYCVKAQVFLKSDMQSGFSMSHCVSITGPGAPPWKQPTAVTLTVIIMLGLLIALFWFIVHCRPVSCQEYFQKEPQPLSLGDFDLRIAISHQTEELCEENPHLLSVGRGEET